MIIDPPPLPRRRSKLRKEPLSSGDLTRPEPRGLGELKRSAHSAEPSAHFERSPSVSEVAFEKKKVRLLLRRKRWGCFWEENGEVAFEKKMVRLLWRRKWWGCSVHFLNCWSVIYSSVICWSVICWSVEPGNLIICYLLHFIILWSDDLWSVDLLLCCWSADLLICDLLICWTW